MARFIAILFLSFVLIKNKGADNCYVATLATIRNE